MRRLLLILFTVIALWFVVARVRADTLCDGEPCAGGEVCPTDVNCVSFENFPTPVPQSTNVTCTNVDDCGGGCELDPCPFPTPGGQAMFAINVPTPWPTTVCSGGGGDPCTSPLACNICVEGQALVANGTNCSGTDFAKGVDTLGNAEGCAVPATATALAANGGNCSGNQFATGVTAAGVAEGCAIPPQIASDGANCSTNQFATGVDAFGVAQGCAIPPRLATNGSNCGSNQFAKGVSETGDAESCAIPPTLASNPANCGAGLFPAGVDATGAVEGCSTPTVWIASGRFSIGSAAAFFLYTSSTTAAAAGTVSQAGTFSGLRCQSSGAPTAGKSYRFRLNVAGAASALDCTISDTGTTCTDLVNTVAVTVGQLITIQMDPAGSPFDNFMACAMVVT